MEGMQVAPAHADPLARLWRWAASRAVRLRDDERYEQWTLSSRELASLEKLRGARRLKALQRAEARRAHNVDTSGSR
jgi:hypothetical protein